VVGAGNPKGVKALHSLVTNENVLKSLVKGVTHVELTGNVWRGNNDGKAGIVIVFVGCEITFVTPFLIYSVLKFRGRICFWKLVVAVHFLNLAFFM
jgi:hypothetical protein